MAVKMSSGAKVGGVAKTMPKAGMKSGAKQTAGNKMFKDSGDVARRAAIKVVHGKSGLPAPATAKGKTPFQVKTQQAAFTNPAGVIKHGAGATKFVC